MFTPHLVHLTNCQAEGRKHISEADLVPCKPAEFTPAFESGCDCSGRIYIRAGFAAGASLRHLRRLTLFPSSILLLLLVPKEKEIKPSYGAV